MKEFLVCKTYVKEKALTKDDVVSRDEINIDFLFIFEDVNENKKKKFNLTTWFNNLQSRR